MGGNQIALDESELYFAISSDLKEKTEDEEPEKWELGELIGTHASRFICDSRSALTLGARDSLCSRCKTPNTDSYVCVPVHDRDD